MKKKVKKPDFLRNAVLDLSIAISTLHLGLQVNDLNSKIKELKRRRDYILKNKSKIVTNIAIHALKRMKNDKTKKGRAK